MIRVTSHILISCQALCQTLADDDPMPSHADDVDIASALAALAHMQDCLGDLIQERSGGAEQTCILSATRNLLALVREALSVEVAAAEPDERLVGDGAAVLVMVTREPDDSAAAGREGTR
jgi:hypothetical protein